MNSSGATQYPGKLFPWIFHLILWSAWIGVPFLNAGENERNFSFALWMLPVTFTRIPFFLLNTEWLIPRIFRKRGIGPYLVSLIVLIAIFSVMGQLYKITFIPQHILGKRTDWFWAITPVLFVAAISTGYGFILYLLRQDRVRQEEQQQRLTSELSFLRSQISPHFIFNILNSIVYLIRSKSDQAESVTIKLSELMRYMLYTPQEEQVPIEKEIEYLENYIALQETRFGEDVNIKFEKTGGDSSLAIEPMILIPFVENAFKHGVGLVDDPLIDIKAQIAEQSFTFFVRNKIGPETVTEKDASSGIGLKNVKRRLELLYPDNHLLDISEDDGWFTVSLTLHKRA